MTSFPIRVFLRIAGFVRLRPPVSSRSYNAQSLSDRALFLLKSSHLLWGLQIGILKLLEVSIYLKCHLFSLLQLFQEYSNHQFAKAIFAICHKIAVSVHCNRRHVRKLWRDIVNQLSAMFHLVSWNNIIGIKCNFEVIRQRNSYLALVRYFTDRSQSVFFKARHLIPWHSFIILLSEKLLNYTFCSRYMEYS